MISKSACPQMLRRTFLSVQKTRRGCAEYASQVTCAYQQGVWNGLVRVCADTVSIGREAGPSISSISTRICRKTLHIRHGADTRTHAHTHTNRQMWVIDIFEPVCIGQLPFYVYGVFESAAITTHTKHTHTDAHSR